MKELKIGIFTVIVLVASYWMISFMKGTNLFKKQIAYTAVVPEANYLTGSTPVTTRGVSVGIIKNVMIDYKTGKRVHLNLNLDKNLRIPTDSYIVIENNPLKGPSLNLILGSKQKFIDAGGEIATRENKKDMMLTVERKILPTIETVLPKIDTLIATLNRQVSGLNLSQTNHSINQLISETKKMVGKLQRAAGQIDPMLTDTRNSMAGIQKTVDKINALPLEKIGGNLQASLNELNQIFAKINNSKGSIGKLLNEKSVVKRIDSLLFRADNLIDDIKKHPRRYLKFSIF